VNEIKESNISLSAQQIPVQYTIRISNRAKYMRLTVSLEKGVVVVVPDFMNKREMARFIPQFVKDKHLWINEAMAKLQAKSTVKKTIDQCQLPEKIVLPAIGQIFSINYRSAADIYDSRTAPKLFFQADHLLEITADREDKTQIFALLEAFFKDYAKYYLKQKLDQLSRASNLSYNRLTIRAQKTRWGSCSAKKNINLNYRLLFIEEELMDYILLHELVHTVHMNHSPAFWTYLESLLPDARSRDKQVNQAAKDLPCWIHYPK